MTRKKPEYVFNGIINVPDIDIEYKGFHIVPKKDFGGYPYMSAGCSYSKGYVVTDGFCNVMAGATWSHDVTGAKVMIDCHIEANGDSNKFWELMRKWQGMDEYTEV